MSKWWSWFLLRLPWLNKSYARLAQRGWKQNLLPWAQKESEKYWQIGVQTTHSAFLIPTFWFVFHPTHNISIFKSVMSLSWKVRVTAGEWQPLYQPWEMWSRERGLPLLPHTWWTHPVYSDGTGRGEWPLTFHLKGENGRHIVNTPNL